MTSPPLTPPRSPWWIRGLLRLPDGFERLMPWANRWMLFWIVLLLIVVAIPLIVTPLTIWQQGVVALALILFSMVIVNYEQRQPQRRASELMHLMLAWLSIVSTLRYLYYRLSYTLNLDSWLSGFFSLLLLAAELYAIATLLLSYFQTLKLRDRHPVSLATIPQDEWYWVDIYIPTYNEDVALVRKTAIAAMAIDYPANKKQVYVLDDGRKFPERREQLRQMCDELGCTLMTRDNNDHAKAGNINSAMHRTGGDLILILDCDHIPARSFLQETVGFFYNPKVALVQTPHWFYNPDPFERNLLTQGRVPVHNELFYKVIQKGNDFWNSAFFCGSAAVVRKAAVLEVGGIAVETVTEDCHTSLRLHSRGYDSVYYDKIMVAGLAPEQFSAYIGQQVRWARGMAQILRLENPLFNRRLHLTVEQRLCYFSATFHFFFGFPRLMYALAPILYLVFGINLVRGLGVETLAYALPHIILGMNANYITNKTVRFSFWNEVFEYAMAFQDGLVTMMAVLNPRLGKFNVTAKGLSVSDRSFDWRSSRVPLFLTILLIVSLLAVPFWLVLRPENREAVVINALWALFNLVLLVTAILVALEQPQLRRTHRLNRQLTTYIHSVNPVVQGRTLDVSESGARILLETYTNLPDWVELELVGDYGKRVQLEGKITRIARPSENQTLIVVDFMDMTPSQFDDLVLVLYSDVAEWQTHSRNSVDKPLGSLKFLTTGLFRAFREPEPATPTEVRKQIRAAAQLYWNGNLYPGVATAMNSRSLQVELDPRTLPDPEALVQAQQPIGVLLSQEQNDPTAARLLAQVEKLSSPNGLPLAPADRLSRSGSIALQLSFPKNLEPEQTHTIRRLLRSLA
ncbi:UDP-forming cellulose synthase catalytic subunit [Phormidium tenue FACHB-886]|nr:UDP-forming cellulose synthase catalytic subunit [Phormidium tenue FACHB-886]